MLLEQFGKLAGTVGSEATVDSLIEQGYRFISTGADVVGLGEYFSRLSSAFGRNGSSDSKKNLYQ